jgi:hypothetical protein
MTAAKERSVKKAAFVLVLALLWHLVPAFGQRNLGQQSPRDLILLVDTSASMSSFYRELRDYITGPFLRESLRLGDTLHIIAFSGEARLEIARRIEERGDLETVIGRMFLLYPLEPGSDIAGVLAYLESYLSQLSPAKPKKVVLVSDGEAFPELPGGIQSLIAETKNRVAGQNASFDFVKVPLDIRPSTPPAPRQPPPSQGAAPPAPQPVVPVLPQPAVVPSGDSEPEPEPVPPPSPTPAPVIPPPPIPPPVIPEEAVPRQPAGPATASSSPPVSPPSPAPQPAKQMPPFPSVLLGLPVFILSGFAVFFLDRRLRRSPNQAVARAANFSGTVDREPVMLNLFVEDQNTFIGKRNIHLVKQGVSFTIGGGKSDFLIFLVPMPFRIADLRYESGSCTLVPRKPEYFPDTGSSPVKDCIGETLRVVSDKNYELFIRVDRCENPMAALSRLINSVALR